MTTVTVKLSKELKDFIEEEVASGKHGSSSELIASLVKAARRQKAEEKLLAMVKEAEESGPSTPMTPEDWENIHREGMNLLAKEKAKDAKRRKTPRSRKRPA